MAKFTLRYCTPNYSSFCANTLLWVVGSQSGILNFLNPTGFTTGRGHGEVSGRMEYPVDGKCSGFFQGKFSAERICWRGGNFSWRKCVRGYVWASTVHREMSSGDKYPIGLFQVKFSGGLIFHREMCEGMSTWISSWWISWLISNRVGKYRDIFENMENTRYFRYIHVYISNVCTYIAKIIWNLLQNNSMCVCVCFAY